MPIKLYQKKESPPVRATLMIIELLGLDVELVEINTLIRDHYKPEYVQKNPQRTIPLLEDDDFLIIDSHAILTYLVSKYGADKKHLYPNDPRSRALVDQRLYFDATIIFPRLLNILRSKFASEKSVSEQLISELTAAYEMLEAHLQKTTYAAGDSLTVADLSLVSTLSSADIIVPVDAKFVKIHEWWNRLKNEAWYKKANEPGLVGLGSLVESALKKSVFEFAKE